MSREYRDLLVKGAPEGEELEEKARGLIRGGTVRTWNAMVKRGRKAKNGEASRIRGALHYLSGRYKNGWRPGSGRVRSDIRSGRYK